MGTGRDSKQRWVVVHQGALGDFLLALHAVEGLVEANGGSPALCVDFWTRRAHFHLMATKPYAGAFHSCDGPELLPFFNEDLQEKTVAPAFFHSADAVFVFGQKSGRFLADGLGSGLSCPVQWIQSFPAAEEGAEAGRGKARHVRVFLREQLERAGWAVKDVVPCIRPQFEAAEEAALWLKLKMDGKGRKPPVLIHPGSGGRRKICPLEHWWGLLDWLMKGLDRPVVMTLGPADDDLKDFALAVKERGAWVAEGLSLPVLVALLDRSSCYLGSDSGVSHLAAAVGVPSLAVFGPTDPAVWGPVGPRVRIIQSRWRDGENLDWTPAKLRHEDKDTGPAIKEWLKNWV